MQQPTELPTLTAPSFYLTSRQPLRPGAILLAAVAAFAALSSVLYALGHNRSAHFTSNNSGAARSADATSGAPPTTTKTIPTRSTPSSSVIPPTLPSPPARTTTSAPFIPPSLFACPATATRSASSPTPPPATFSTTGSPPSTRQATPRLVTLCRISRWPPRPRHRWSSGRRPAASVCSRPKRSSPVSSSSGSATRHPPQLKSSALYRFFRIPPRPKSRPSASALSPYPGRTPPRNHRDEFFRPRSFYIVTSCCPPSIS